MSKPATIIANYVGCVTEMQQQRADQLSEADLRSIAQELGLQTEDIQYAERAAEDHIQRAAHYLQNQMCDDAIEELAAAVMLRPLRGDILCRLAEAYATRWEASGRSSDRTEADQIARQVLLLEPHNQAAYALRKKLKENTSTPARSPLIVGGLVLAAVLAISVLSTIGIALMLFLRESEPPSQPILVDPTAELDGVTEAQDGSLELTTVPVSALPGATLVPAQDMLSVYDEAWSYRANGRLLNDSGSVITALKGQVVLRDADGAVIAQQTFDAQQDYNVPLRPGEVRGFETLIYRDGASPVPASAELVVAHVAHEIAATSYPPDTPVTLQWATNAPPGVSLSAALRSSRYSDFLNDQLFHRAEYVITVDAGSAAVSLLKLRLDQLDAAGTVIGKSDESYVLSTTHPALEPGESRSVVFLSYQTEQPASIQVTVVDAR